MKFFRVYHNGIAAFRKRAGMNNAQRTAMRASHTPAAVYSRCVKEH